MITTNNPELAAKLRRLRDHGAAMSDLQRHVGPKPYLLADHLDAGYNQRMTDLQAALGVAQMQRADAIVSERRKLAAHYDKAFADLSWLRVPSSAEGFSHGYQSYPCLFEPEEVEAALANHDIVALQQVREKRNAWMETLQQQGISTRPSTHAVHMLTYYKEKYGLECHDFPRAYAANDCSISLPLFHGMTEAERQHVIKAVRSRAV